MSSNGSETTDPDEQAQQETEPSSLLLTADEVAQQMARLRSKYPTSEADYLAAARARSAAKTQSVQGAATDDDFEQLAQQKRQQVGDIDDWEQSKAEAGNSDSQILIPMNIVVEDNDNGDADEPKLLLF
jgi:hypothetical protein